jgi:hypothetical protein
MPAAADLSKRLWHAALLRRAPAWLAGAVPWCVLPSIPGLLAWAGLVAFDALRLRQRAGRDWARWLDDAVPEFEDSSALLANATTPVAQLQRERMLVRLQASLSPQRMRGIARERVPAGYGWTAGSVLIAALAWGAGTLGHAVPGAAAPLRATAAVPTAPELLVRVAPPKYTGAAPIESGPRDLLVPEGSVVHWCLKNPQAGAAVVELSDGRTLQPGGDCASLAATESLFWRWRGTRYNLRVTPDQPPEITVSAPNEMVHELRMDAQSAAMAVTVRDDYAVSRATLHLTLARGSGENIRFSDRELPLPASPDPRVRAWSKQWLLSELGMEPGDELYFFVRATDNAQRAHSVQSATYTLRLPAPAAAAEDESTALPTLVKPESLRSQRQIIIDTEQLVADMKGARKPDAAAVRERSEAIASDQAALRRRYGQFLGEESTLFGGADHDDDHDGGKHDVLHEFGHAHDQPENATLFDDATKKVLRRALGAMWDAEKSLRAIIPAGALPPEHTALDAIKELQQADRIYLHKTAFTPPAIKEEKRMSGDVVGASSYKREQQAPGEAVPEQVRELVQSLALDAALPALWSRTAHDWVREHIANDEQRLAAQRAIQDVADGCVPCRASLRAWLRGAVAQAPVLLQARPVADTPFARAWREGGKK